MNRPAILRERRPVVATVMLRLLRFAAKLAGVLAVIYLGIWLLAAVTAQWVGVAATLPDAHQMIMTSFHQVLAGTRDLIGSITFGWLPQQPALDDAPFVAGAQALVSFTILSASLPFTILSTSRAFAYGGKMLFPELTESYEPLIRELQNEALPPSHEGEPDEYERAREREAAVLQGLAALDLAWLDYLLDPEEAFLSMPRLRDDAWPATRRYREAMADLGIAIEHLQHTGGEPGENRISDAEHALVAAEDAWSKARLAARAAGAAELPLREQAALRRAHHHLSVLENPNLPPAIRAERLRQLQTELTKLNTVPITYQQVLAMPQLEPVRRLALAAGDDAVQDGD